jgi:hypothetical protein
MRISRPNGATQERRGITSLRTGAYQEPPVRKGYTLSRGGAGWRSNFGRLFARSFGALLWIRRRDLAERWAVLRGIGTRPGGAVAALLRSQCRPGPKLGAMPHRREMQI